MRNRAIRICAAALEADLDKAAATRSGEESLQVPFLNPFRWVLWFKRILKRGPSNV